MEQNEKMFNRLLCILKKGNKVVDKHRNNAAGPQSLNIGKRRATIATINHENEVFSKRLSLARSIVPSVAETREFTSKMELLKKNSSTRNRDGSPKPDPLILMKKLFDKSTKRNSMFLVPPNKTFVSSQTIG